MLASDNLSVTKGGQNGRRMQGWMRLWLWWLPR
jgi:hypothetical protein